MVLSRSGIELGMVWWYEQGCLSVRRKSYHPQVESLPRSKSWHQHSLICDTLCYISPNVSEWVPSHIFTPSSLDCLQPKSSRRSWT